MATTIAELSTGFPDVAEKTLHLSIGACRLRLRPYDGEQWIDGEYEYPEGLPMPKMRLKGGDLKVSQEMKAATLNFRQQTPRFDLRLGKAQPYGLNVEGGAYEGKMELGGLPLRQFRMQQGAGKLQVAFGEPNPEVMELLKLEAGAMAVQLQQLANANFRRMEIHAGASKLDLDFSGTLRENAQVHINSSAASVQIRLPATTPAVFYTRSSLGSVSFDKGFTRQDNGYLSPAALEGQVPLLTVHVELSIGRLAVELI